MRPALAAYFSPTGLLVPKKLSLRRRGARRRPVEHEPAEWDASRLQNHFLVRLDMGSSG
jgi:hypothetical protein